MLAHGIDREHVGDTRRAGFLAASAHLLPIGSQLTDHAHEMLDADPPLVWLQELSAACP
jgi:hypothetical protein